MSPLSDAFSALSFRRPPPGPARCWTVGTLGPGSAGASTLAVAVATRVSGLVVEADVDGGVLGARYGPWPNESVPSLASLLAALHSYAGAAPAEDHLQPLPGGARAALVAPDAEGALGPVLRLVEDLEDLRQTLLGETMVLDVGRVRPGSPSLMLADQSDALIAVVRPEAESLGCLLARLPVVLQQVPRLLVAVRGEGPYGLADIRAAIALRAGIRIPVVGVPEDARGVQALRRARKTGLPSWTGAGLMHSASVLVSLLAGPGAEEAPSTPPYGIQDQWPLIPPTSRGDADRAWWPGSQEG